MILNQRVELHGDKQDRIIEALEMAGWYKNRQVDISAAKNYYSEIGIELFQKAKDFLAEFSGIARQWYIEFENLNHASDFTFVLCPEGTDPRDYMYDDEQYKFHSSDYDEIFELAQEKFVFVGEIGYYYPARVWIGESGNLYTTHDYDDKAHAFKSIFELILDELKFHEMLSVAMTL